MTTKRVNDEAAREGGRRGARADPAYPLDDIAPELRILADVALRVTREREQHRHRDLPDSGEPEDE